MAFDADLFVIGGGSGGVRAARMAAGAGARVHLAEQSRMGGTCVLRGCVPKKLMVFASQFGEAFDLASHYGWAGGGVGGEASFHWPPFRKRLHAELDRLEGIYRRLLDAAGVTVHDGRATLDDPHTVRLADGSTVTAAHVLIATGGRPVRPELPGAERGLVSDDVFLLPELPRSLLIVGGGYIACEMACILNGMGVQVTQFYRGAQVLRGFDEEARGLVAEGIRACGVDLHTGTDLIALGHPDDDFDVPVGETMTLAARTRGGPVKVKATNGHVATFDAVLFATGRRPNTEGLGLEALGVGLSRWGHVEVDPYSQTAVPSIYALGDATGRPALTPVAIRDAMAFVDTVFHGRPTTVDHQNIPSAVFTQPEFGTVGLSEEAARDKEPIEVYATSFRPMRTAFADKPHRVLMKLVVSQATRRVLGVHIVAPEAGEMIQFAGVAIKMGATKEDFDRTVAVHPTMAEEIVTLRQPVRRSS